MHPYSGAKSGTQAEKGIALTMKAAAVAGCHCHMQLLLGNSGSSIVAAGVSA